MLGGKWLSLLPVPTFIESGAPNEFLTPTTHQQDARLQGRRMARFVSHTARGFLRSRGVWLWLPGREAVSLC